MQDSKKAAKLESKLQTTTQGYVQRALKIEQGVIDAHETFRKTSIELSKHIRIMHVYVRIYLCNHHPYVLLFVCSDAFSSLIDMEGRAIPMRVSAAQAEAKASHHSEAGLQRKYSALMAIINNTLLAANH